MPARTPQPAESIRVDAPLVTLVNVFRESEEDFRAMLGDPAARAHMDQLGPIAVAEPTLCHVISVHHA